MFTAVAPGMVQPGYTPMGVPMGMGFNYGGMSKGGKGKGKGKGPRIEKPVVNPNQLNPIKDPMDGGVSWKNILQEKIAKSLHRTIQPGDVNYTVDRVAGGKTCTISIPALGPEHVYASTRPGRDDKHAGQFAAALALETLFPDVYAACFEAHTAALSTCAETGGPIEAVGNSEPKGLLNGRLSLVIGRQLNPGDVNYDTQWNPMLGGYGSVLTVPCLGDPSLVIYASDAQNIQDPKAAEKDAAKKCLDANRSLFDQAAMAGQAKKERLALRVKGYKGKGRGVPINNSYTPY